MYFNALKGQYPSLAQSDFVLDVGSGEAIVRGALMYVDARGTKPVYRLAGVAQATDPAALLYVALMPNDDFVAGMAGTVGQGIAGGVARVNGLALTMDLEYQTDEVTADEVFTVNQLVTVGADGKLTAHTSGDNCVGVVTAPLAPKWANDAVIIPGRKTGGNVTVLALRTMWIPKLVTTPAS